MKGALPGGLFNQGKGAFYGGRLVEHDRPCLDERHTAGILGEIFHKKQLLFLFE